MSVNDFKLYKLKPNLDFSPFVWLKHTLKGEGLERLSA